VTLNQKTMSKDYLLSQIRDKRKELGLSHEDVSSILDVSVSQYYKLESGKSEISLEKLISLCDFLDLELKIQQKKIETNEKLKPIIDDLSNIINKLKDL
jgi:transcriptional regulator with XRE-family HTH domain